MKILALDLGKFNSVACFFNAKNRKAKFVTTPTTREHLTAIFTNNKANLVVMEACGPSGWINDLAQEHGLKTLVCSTNEEAWRWANVKRKTDRDDALKLARMAAMGELKGVHTPTPQHREFRSLVKYRKTLDNRINKTKNTIRAWFVNHGIEIASGEKAWHTGREKINSFCKPLADCDADELWKGELDIELTILDSLTEQLAGVVKRLEAIGKTDERLRRVQTIPGVGPRTAEILVACIDDAHRFENGRQVSAYFGLVPRQYQSGETDRNGRITKRGNPLARTILVECAWASLRYNPWAKGVYERICGKQKTRKKKAAIALARKLAVIAWAMLRDERDWDPNKMIDVTKSYGGKLPMDEEALRTMPKKECRHKRKRRLAKERQAAEQAKLHPSAPERPRSADKKSCRGKKAEPSGAKKPITPRSKTTKNPPPSSTRRRARKPVSRT
ncbi:transposase [Rhodopirellula rubra]|uniref:Transposase n=1 Tax=Aporhodopirellula rubra TaxID=980271 RepID=A0A7W5E2W3_9BACT|nr:IS110 family transposase [Aporhodopirellula rubra]MBB3209231.1 transposase [Aporhodopirellula rubra]